MIIECAFCESKVDGKIIGEVEEFIDEIGELYRVSLLQCPVCKSAIVSGQDYYQVSAEKWKWGDAKRLWPDPEKYLDWNLPELVRNSLDEARKCYKCKAYSSCAVMCGRALESILAEYKTKNKTLAGGLKELLEKQVIDKRIFDWGEALRLHRNIGAHATDEKISKEDAKDLLEFTNAICDYVFILTNKFEKFMKRKEKDKSLKK